MAGGLPHEIYPPALMLPLTLADFAGDGRDDVLLTPGVGGGPVLLGFDAGTGNQLFGVFVGNPADRTGGNRA